MNRRHLVTGLGIVALLALLAVPVLAGWPGQGATRPARPRRRSRRRPSRISGTIDVTTDENGNDTYTLPTAERPTRSRLARRGSSGNNHPLKPFVGKSVTVDGEVAEGGTEVDVQAVNGTALREPGKPPWAGGWKVVGERHPGWSQEKADRFKAKFGDCFPPGQCKEKPAGGDEDEPEG